MAILYDARWRAIDSSGAPISGATLTVYTAGTTTPASIFRDAALATPMSNPTSGSDKADSAGRFPQVYAAEGSTLDVLLKDAVGSTLASYLSVVPQGASTGALTRDFTTSRFGARGSGGTTFVETGDPTGDDVGGKMTLGGWNNTQADLITVNGALVNVVGRIKENSYKIPGVVRSEAVVVAASATMDIPLTNDPTGVRGWDIDVFDIVLSASAQLSILFSYDGGSTFKSGASDYAYAIDYNTATATASAVSDDANVGGYPTVGNMTATATLPGRLRLNVITPNSGAAATVATGTSVVFDNGSPKRPVISTFAIYGLGGYGRATHARLWNETSGTIAGTYRVIPQRGLGEV